VPSESAAHLPGIHSSRAAIAAGQDEVPVDDGIVTVAPWATEPLCLHGKQAHGAAAGRCTTCAAGTGGAADPTVTGVAPWARTGGVGASGAGGAGGAIKAPASVMDHFIEAFGAPPRSRSGSRGSAASSPRVDGAHSSPRSPLTGSGGGSGNSAGGSAAGGSAAAAAGNSPAQP
jgi:hypothetical protein